MAIKDIKTNRNDLQEYLKLIAEIPEKIYKIDIDIKKELLIEIDIRIQSLFKEICELISNNPQYPYPENYLPDKLFDYWSSKVSQVFTINELKNLKLWIEKSFNLVDAEIKIENKPLLNPYPLIFINGNVYECFKNYIKNNNNIVEFYIDYSYLKKRMLKENLIHNLTDIKFMYFLINDLKIKIPLKQHEMFINNDSKFYCLSKVDKLISRINNFDRVFESVL